MTLAEATQIVRAMADAQLALVPEHGANYAKRGKALLMVLNAAEQLALMPPPPGHHFTPASYNHRECARCGAGVDQHDMEAALRGSLQLIRGAGL